MTDAKIISDLLALPPKRRAKIAGALLRSLDDEDLANEQEIEDAWAKEIELRVKQIRSGKVKAIPGDLFLKKLQAKAKRARRRAK